MPQMLHLYIFVFFLGCVVHSHLILYYMMTFHSTVTVEMELSVLWSYALAMCSPNQMGFRR